MYRYTNILVQEVGVTGQTSGLTGWLAFGSPVCTIINETLQWRHNTVYCKESPWLTLGLEMFSKILISKF